MRKSDLFFNVLRLPVDFVMLLAAGLVTYLFRTEILASFRPVLFEFNLPIFKYFYLVIFVAFLFEGAFALSGLYSMKVRLGVADEFLKIIIASSAGIMLVIIYIFLSQELFDSRFLVLGGWFFAILFVSLGRLTVRGIQKFTVSRYNFGVQRVMVIGNDEWASMIDREIKDDPASGYEVVKRFADLDVVAVKTVMSSLDVDEIILTHPHYSESNILELVDLCNEYHIIFKFVPNVSHLLTGNYSIDIFRGLPFIEIRRTSLDGWGRVIKRSIDIAGAVFGLIVLSPLFGLVALAIKWETDGPVYVRLKRVSTNKEFDLIKFRSMINNAHELNLYLRSLGNDRPDSGPLWKLKNDPRITKVGKLIRRTRIDELPQLWNVIKGEMSLVGPRPHEPNEIDKYQKHHRKVLVIKSGATGFAQVSGSSDIGFEQEVALDSFYIDNWSLWLDMRIIIKTVIKMLRDKSAV